MICSTLLLAASLLQLPAGLAEDPLADPLRALERQMHGVWHGDGPCDGELVLDANGTFERRHFSPGNNSLTGTWKIRWDALPPTLVLACEKSDRPFFVGRTSEVQLLQLNDKFMVYQYRNQARARYTRPAE